MSSIRAERRLIDEVARDFEVTRKRIDAIEAVALVKLHRARGRDVLSRVARSLGISVAELQRRLDDGNRSR